MQLFDLDGLADEVLSAKNENEDELYRVLKRLIGLYQQFPVSAVQWLPEQCLVLLVKHLKAREGMFKAIASVKPLPRFSSGVQSKYLELATGAYAEDFKELHPIIAFAATTMSDYARLEADGRVVLEQFKLDLGEQRESLKRLLDSARSDIVDVVATKQAAHFEIEADRDSRAAWFWFSMTLGGIAATIAVAIAALFAHTFEVLSPTSLYEAIQLAVGKVVVLASVGSFAVLAGRQYAANRHNEVVNRHRCNALRTYRALVEAAGDNDVRGIVLAQAAHAIFADQPTGFTRTDTSDGRSAPLVNVSHRSMGTGDGGVGS